jgi:DNA-binding NarL/FixJ family response regulator
VDDTKAQVVALFNTNPDLLDIVRLGLERAGFIVVIGHVHDIRTGALELGPFMDQHRPKVIVYDLVMPYDRNWAFMKHVREHPVMNGRQFVVTTPNQRAAQAVVGRDEQVHEIVSDQDVDAVLMAVRDAIKARPTK